MRGQEEKTKIVYKRAKIPGILRSLGYFSASFMGVVGLCMMVGSWFGLEVTYPEAILVFKVLFTVAFGTNLIVWTLADKLLKGDLE